MTNPLAMLTTFWKCQTTAGKLLFWFHISFAMLVVMVLPTLLHLSGFLYDLSSKRDSILGMVFLFGVYVTIRAVTAVMFGVKSMTLGESLCHKEPSPGTLILYPWIFFSLSVLTILNVYVLIFA